MTTAHTYCRVLGLSIGVSLVERAGFVLPGLLALLVLLRSITGS